MQLFILDYNPRKAAQMLADTHVRKMCLETAQILSAILIKNGINLQGTMPKPHNLNHPIVKAINTPQKINWVVKYNIALQKEFLYRFEKKHAYYELQKSYRSLLFKRVKIQESDCSFAKDFKNFTTATTDVVMAYREYYKYKKNIIKSWHYTKRSAPFL